MVLQVSIERLDGDAIRISVGPPRDCDQLLAAGRPAERPRFIRQPYPIDKES